jgi:hypothetical protein
MDANGVRNMYSVTAVINEHTAKLHHIGSLYKSTTHLISLQFGPYRMASHDAEVSVTLLLYFCDVQSNYFVIPVTRFCYTFT